MSVGTRSKGLLAATVMALMMSGIAVFLIFTVQNGSTAISANKVSGVASVQQATVDCDFGFSSVKMGTSVILEDTITNTLGSIIPSLLIIGTISVDAGEDKHDTLRARILHEIENFPGIHLRELRRHLDCAMGALQYHLSNLEEAGLVVSHRMGNTRHLFIDGFTSEGRNMELAALIRNPTVRSIIQQCLAESEITQAELSRVLSLDKSLVSYYVSSLLDADVVQKLKVFGREKPLIVKEWAAEAISDLGLALE